MKISKKDKIVLITLFFIIIIGVFIMYGIVPASDELKEAQAKEAELQKQFDTLVRTYNSHNPSTKIDQMEKIVMDYYLDDSDDYVVVDKEIEAHLNFMDICNEILDTLSTKHVFISEDYVHQAKTLRHVSLKDNKDDGPEDKSYLLCAETTFNYDAIDPSEATVILEVFLTNPNIQVKDVKVNYDGIKYSGVVVISKFYLDGTKFIPLPLVNNPKEKLDLIATEDAPLVYAPNKEEGTLSFETIPHAKYYEIYEAFYNDSFEVSYSSTPVMTNIQAQPDESGIMPTQIEVNYKGSLRETTATETHYYVVVAVGNYEDFWFKNSEDQTVYYRTIMSKYLAINNKFTV